MPALVAGIHVLLSGETHEDVDGRDKPGHDACCEWSCCASLTDAITNSGLPIRTIGTWRGS